jgi:hypothetical protein
MRQFVLGRPRDFKYDLVLVNRVREGSNRVIVEGVVVEVTSGIAIAEPIVSARGERLRLDDRCVVLCVPLARRRPRVLVSLLFWRRGGGLLLLSRRLLSLLLLLVKELFVVVDARDDLDRRRTISPFEVAVRRVRVLLRRCMGECSSSSSSGKVEVGTMGLGVLLRLILLVGEGVPTTGAAMVME